MERSHRKWKSDRKTPQSVLSDASNVCAGINRKEVYGSWMNQHCSNMFIHYYY